MDRPSLKTLPTRGPAGGGHDGPLRLPGAGGGVRRGGRSRGQRGHRARDDRRRRSEAAIAAQVQLGTAIAVAPAVSIPFLFLPLDRVLDVAAFATAALVGVTAYAVARAGGVRHHRAMGHGAVALVMAVIIVGVKALLAAP